MHLDAACQILESGELAERGRQLLTDELPAFLLGNVAPDLQAINDAPREQTHFYRTPIPPNHKAWEEMWARFPLLAAPSEMPAEAAAFMAGYIAHLIFDTLWFHRVLQKLVLTPDHWKSVEEQALSHSLALIYLDKLALGRLPANVPALLASAQPNEWLPFASDGDIVRWRDAILPQLTPGAPISAIQIYANRLQMPATALNQKLNNPAWVDANLFQKIPFKSVGEIIEQATTESATLLNRYLSAN